MGLNPKLANFFLHNFKSNLCLCSRAKRAQRAVILSQQLQKNYYKPTKENKPTEEYGKYISRYAHIFSYFKINM